MSPIVAGTNATCPRLLPRNSKFRLVLPILLLVMGVFSQTLTAQEPLETQEKRPNILFILVDDSGYSDLGCYGSEIATPNLDRLAANGLRFSQFYNTARCWPTRAALMTGYYAQMVHRDRMPGMGGGNGGKRQPWAKMVPEYLKPFGYRAYHSGKWHLDGKALAAGFDRSYIRQNQGNYFTEKGNLENDRPVKPADDESGYYATTGTTNHAIDCLKEHAAKFSDRPFFHYVAFIAPHFPLHAPQQDIDKYRDRYLSGWDQLRQERLAKQKTIGLVDVELSPLEPDVGPPYAFPDALKKLGPNEVNRPLPWNTLTADQQRFQATKMAIHAAMVDRIDIEVGRILDQLKSMNAFEDTLIFFASDNGASAEIMVRDGGHDPNAAPGSSATYLCLGPGFSSACNTPFRRHKTWVHEGGISSPLIVHWPNGFQGKNEIRHSPGHMVDILPTILDVVGAERPDNATGGAIPSPPGRSLVPAFHNDVVIDRPFLWWMHEDNLAIRIGDWKLVSDRIDRDPIQPKEPKWELYDLSKDRAETNNLIEKQPDVGARLKKAWYQQLELTKKLLSETTPETTPNGQ